MCVISMRALSMARMGMWAWVIAAPNPAGIEIVTTPDRTPDIAPKGPEPSPNLGPATAHEIYLEMWGGKLAPLRLNIFDILLLITDHLASDKSSQLFGSTSISDHVVIIYHVS